MHIIAYVYHWSATELWGLPILERKMWVNLIIEQKEREAEEGVE